MPLIETDTIYSFLNRTDKFHDNAVKLIQKINTGEFNVKLSSVSLIELNFIYKLQQIEEEFEKDLGYLQAIKNLELLSLNIRNFLTGIMIYKTFKITFYNSLHAGIAINFDNIIISEDSEYDLIPGLKRKSLSDFQ